MDGRGFLTPDPLIPASLHAPGTGPIDMNLGELAPQILLILEEDKPVLGRTASPFAFVFILDQNFHLLAQPALIEFGADPLMLLL